MFQKVTSGDAGSWPGRTSATGRLVDMHAVQYGYSILCLDSENAYFHAEEDEEVYCWPPKEWVKMYHVRGAAIALLAIRND